MIPYKIQLIEDRPPEVTIRQWREMLRGLHAELGEHWHREILPRHFAPNARNRYRHQGRTLGWNRRKEQLRARGKAHPDSNADNIFTGLMRDLLTNSATIRSTPTRSTLGMTGPRYLTMRPKNTSSQPNKAEEILTVLNMEDRELGNVAEAYADREMSQIKTSPKVLTL